MTPPETPDTFTPEVAERLAGAIADFEADADDADSGERTDLWDQVVEVDIGDARTLLAHIATQDARIAVLSAALNTPELLNFAEGVRLEAAHQRERWSSEHDAGKEPEDWFWLLGYLGGKALRSAREGDRDKALHHTISSAAVLANWHAALLGVNTSMRPGIEA